MSDAVEQHLAAIADQLRILNATIERMFAAPEPVLPARCCDDSENRTPLGFGSSRWACRVCGTEGGE